jgi:hypothetical protein
MSHQAVNWAIEQRAGGPAPKATLWSIANYANEDWCSWPSRETISAESEQSTDSVTRQIKDLERAGLIRLIPMRYAGRRSNNFYILGPSPYFRRSLSEIERLLPRGYTPLVRSETIESPQFDLENDAADCGNDDAANGVATDAANDAALVRQQVNPGTSEPAKVVEESRARIPLVGDEAITLAEEIATIAGFPDPKAWPPGWCGAAMRVETFLREGYHPDILRAGTREVMAGHGSKPPPWSIAFFERAFARMRARQEAPLPPIQISEARSNEAVQVQPDKSVSAFAGALARRLGSEANSVGVRSLPPGRLQRPGGICDDPGNEPSTVSDGSRGIRD